MATRFVTAYSKSTGRRQSVPESYIDHPVLGRDLTRTKPSGSTSSGGGSSRRSRSQSTTDQKE